MVSMTFGDFGLSIIVVVILVWIGNAWANSTLRARLRKEREDRGQPDL